VISGEYPPDLGGVADYTAAVAEALAANGAEVHVWARGDRDDLRSEPGGVRVHRFARRLGRAGLARLGRRLDGFPAPRTILIQYVPHAFGWKAMNVPFAVWAWWRARRGDDVRVMFHEVAFPWVWQPLRHNMIAAANRVMAAILLRSCSRVYVSTASWGPRLQRLGSGPLPLVWTPVPSGIPAEVSAAGVAARRAELTRGDPAARVLGHFGTYGATVTQTLSPALRALLESRPDVRVLLLGAGGDRWRDGLVGQRRDWLGRIDAPGVLPAPTIAEYLRACDLVLQPYPDGASGRRTTLMAALANGVPVVTTIGDLSEPIWSEGAVATVSAGDPGRLARLALELLGAPDRCAALGRAGRKLYEDRFALRHTIAALLDPPAPSS
jgi:glycosyltransferase involved in cell wall biosynthesis